MITRNGRIKSATRLLPLLLFVLNCDVAGPTLPLHQFFGFTFEKLDTTAQLTVATVENKDFPYHRIVNSVCSLYVWYTFVDSIQDPLNGTRYFLDTAIDTNFAPNDPASIQTGAFHSVWTIPTKYYNFPQYPLLNYEFIKIWGGVFNAGYHRFSDSLTVPRNTLPDGPKPAPVDTTSTNPAPVDTTPTT